MKQYEITNHPPFVGQALGNVLTTVTDNKLAVNSGGMVSGYLAQISSSSDYYPFGSLQPGRNFNAGDYRFGFNGQEMDNEVTGGVGNTNTAMFWEYDTRLGRRWNVDPVVKVHESPYACFANNPIFCIDPNGNDTVPKSKEASQNMSKYIKSPTKEINRSWLGRMLTGKKTKTVENENYQPAIVQIVNDFANDPNKTLYWTNDIKDIPYNTNNNINGKFMKISENEYIIYWNANEDISEIGTTPLFEEFFYLDNVLKGETVLEERNGLWGVYDYQRRLDDEALAKHKVITHINNIVLSRRINLTYEAGAYTDVYTYFGYMYANKMTTSDIRIFISTGAGKLHYSSIYIERIENGSYVNKSTGMKYEYRISGEGAYFGK